MTLRKWLIWWWQDHLVECPSVGKIIPHVSLQPFSLYFSSILPVSSYAHFKIAEQLAPLPPQGSLTFEFPQGSRPGTRGGMSESARASVLFHLSPISILAIFLPPGSGRSGPVCWRCRDPGHFQDRCPVTEVGTLILVPDSLWADPNVVDNCLLPVGIQFRV